MLSVVLEIFLWTDRNVLYDTLINKQTSLRLKLFSIQLLCTAIRLAGVSYQAACIISPTFYAKSDPIVNSIKYIRRVTFNV